MIKFAHITVLLLVFLSSRSFCNDLSSASRIASLSLASDEILLDLLPSCGGVSRLIALSTLSEDSSMSSVTQKAHLIRGRVHSEPESLFALKPDLVIAATFNRPELLKMTTARKIPLLTLTRFASAEDIAHNIEQIGSVIGCKDKASLMKQDFLRKASAVTKTGPRPTLLLYDPDIVIMGQGTLFDDLATRAGASNVASTTGVKSWPKLDAEALLRMNPDAIVVLGSDSATARSTIKNHPAWGRLNAVKSGKIIFLTSRTAQSTSHYFADAVNELGNQISKINLLK
jgi:iron complex transport system substrate-binding protein